MIDDRDLDARLGRAGGTPPLGRAVDDELGRMHRAALAEAEALAPARGRALFGRIGLKPALLGGAVALALAGCAVAVVATQMSPVMGVPIELVVPGDPAGDWQCSLNVQVTLGANEEGTTIEEFLADWDRDAFADRVAAGASILREDPTAITEGEFEMHAAEAQALTIVPEDGWDSDVPASAVDAVTPALLDDLAAAGFDEASVDTVASSCRPVQ